MSQPNRHHRIVVKVGTSTLTYGSGKLNLRCIERLARIISDLHNCGYELVLVSSGAIGVGANKLGLRERPRTTRMKQAAAAVGQCELMHIYDKMFLEYGVTVAQILLTRSDIDSRHKRENIHNTFDALLETGTVPIVNENDTVATEEIEAVETFGDNDTLSAIVAVSVQADLLILLSDINGLYTADPHTHPDAKLISVVEHITPEMEAAAGGAGSRQGTGGMITKLGAAKMATSHGVPMIIANGEDPTRLYDIVDGVTVGTLFLAKEM